MIRRLAIAAALSLCVSACASLPPLSRQHLADSIATGVSMVPQTIQAPPFILTAYAKISAPGQSATVYIEGDGQAWLDRHTPSMDPTPTDPVALRLAALDPSPNVIWLARPCQYTKMESGACPQKYWMGARMAPEVIQSLNAALDQLKARYRVMRYDLVGFSGGGGAAVILAGRRNDVASLRTVAGNVDHGLFSRLHNISPLSGSLEPRESGQVISNMPQIHFIGGDDTVVPRDLADSLLAAESHPFCAHVEVIPGIAHDNGWLSVWPELVKKPLLCQ